MLRAFVGLFGIACFDVLDFGAIAFDVVEGSAYEASSSQERWIDDVFKQFVFCHRAAVYVRLL